MSNLNSDFHKYLNLVAKNKKLFAITALAIMVGAVLVAYILPKKYEAKSTVFIEKNVITELVKGIATTPSMDDSLKVLNYALTSRTLLMKVINEVDFDQKNRDDVAIERLVTDLQKNTKITVNQQDLFVISFRHTNPRIARDYVNSLVRNYIEESMSAKRTESYDAAKFLSEQIDSFKEKMDKAEDTVSDYKNRNGAVVSLDEGSLTREIANGRQRLQDLVLKEKMLEEQLSISNVASDPLQVKLAALQKRLAELRVDFSETYPEVISVKSHIESLQEEIRAKKGPPSPVEAQENYKLQAELKAVREGIKSVQQYITETQRTLASIPTAKASLEKLQGEKNNEKMMYDLLHLRQNQSEVSKQMELQDKSTTYRVVDPAVTPMTPVSPNRLKILLMGIVAGVGGAFGLIILRDFLHSSVMLVDSLKEFNLPVIAIIPLIKNDEELAAIRRSDRRVYLFSFAGFSVIMVVLVAELLGKPWMDHLMNRLYLPQVASRLLGKFL